jgi:hypothetical protein
LESAQAAEAKAESAAHAKIDEARQEIASLSAQISKIRKETDTQVRDFIYFIFVFIF